VTSYKELSLTYNTHPHELPTWLQLQNSNGDHDPHEAYENSEKAPDNNSVGPELTQERAIEHAHRQQNSPPWVVPPVAGYHCASTTIVRTPTDEEAGKDVSLAEGRQAKSQHHPTKHMKLQDYVFKKKHYTRAPSLPDPQILGFNPKHHARQISHLRYTTNGEPHIVSSKAESSRRSQHRSAATARSEDLRFSPEARGGSRLQQRRLQEGNDVCRC
jgi:hypothetical protein